MVRKRKVSIILAAVMLLALIIPQISASAAAPAGWNKLSDYQIFKDKAVGGWSGSGAGELETVNSTLPLDTAVTYNGLPSLRLNVAKDADSGWWISLLTVRDWCTQDFTQYVPNGYIEFNVKGKLGGEYFRIGFRDKVYERTAGLEKDVSVDVTKFNAITTEWTNFKIPLKDIITPGSVFDPANVQCLLLDKLNTKAFTVWINDIKITSPDTEKVFPAIKVNQVGFLKNSEKYALVTGFENVLTAVEGTLFQVKRVQDNTVAYEGKLTLVSDFESIDSGERIFRADFSSLTAEGQYYISVSAAGIENSPKFKIGNDVYKSLLVDASRYFYYQRTGLDLVAPYSPDYPRKDITPMDANAVHDSNTALTRDLAKGWYDAGDKGKYVNAGATAVSDLLWAYDMFTPQFEDNQFNIPEGGNGISDILDEVKWELDWMLKMQDTQSGGFYARVQSDNDEKPTSRIIKDKEGTRTNIRTTDDTACAAAVLAHAYITYKNIDANFANQCLAAAKSAWTYLQNNPGNIQSPSGPYSVGSDKSDRLWAAASLYRATGDQKYNNYFISNYVDFSSKFEDKDGYAHTWADNWLTAFFCYMKAQGRDEQAESWFNTKFNIWLNNMLARYEGNPWKNAIASGNYYWGINMQVMNVPMDAYIGTKLLGKSTDSVSKFAMGSLNWLLGANPMRKSFVSGYGDDAAKTVYSTIYSSDNKPGIPKGYMPGGPNCNEGKGISKFAAKCFIESAGDWVTNEHTVYWNSPLVFITAFANASAQAPVLRGDVNGDGSIDALDFAVLKKYLLGIVIPPDPIIEPGKFKLVDLNGDGVIDALDFALLKKILLGMV